MKTILKSHYLIGLLFLISCSGGNVRSVVIEVKPERTSISGSLSKHIEIIDDIYEFEQEYTSSLAIRVKVLEMMDPKILKGTRPVLAASMLSENGVPIASIQRLEIDHQSKNTLQEILAIGEGECIIYFTSNLGTPSKEQLKKLKLFTVTSSLEDYEVNSHGFTAETKTEEASSNQYDLAIDELEIAVNDATKMMKKYNSGDYDNALTDYTKMMSRIQKASIKLSSAEGELSEDQMERIAKLQIKLAKIQGTQLNQ